MKTTISIFCLLLVNTLAASTVNKDGDKLIISETFFPDKLAVYAAEHDVISIMVPLNALNIKDRSHNSEDTDSHVISFIVEADVKDGVKDYKGLYLLKDGQATKLLDQGTDAAAANENTTNVYFSAKDGIYIYDGVTNTIEKYGTITESLIGIVKENGTGVIYVLTEDHILYKVTEEGTKKKKVEEAENPQEIVLDFNNNLYYYGPDNKPFVITSEGKKKITGLPENPKNAKLIRPPIIIKDGVYFLIDDTLYKIHADGSSIITNFQLQVKPTTYSVEGVFVQYFAYKKKVYEYIFVVSIVNGELVVKPAADEIKRL